MEITTQSLPGSRYQATISLTALEVAEYYESALRRIAPTINVAGFRTGKAPLPVIKEQIKAERLREEAYSLAVQHSWNNVLKDLKVTPIQDPEVEVDDFKEGSASVLTISFDVRPEVKLGDWKKISSKSVKPEEVTNEEVEEVLVSLARSQAPTVIKITPASSGDKVEITFSGEINGQKVAKLSSAKFPVIIGQTTLVPGFEKELLGVKKGDKKEFTLTFPNDHFDTELRNKAVKFSVTVDEVFQIVLPKFDEVFATKFGHKDMKELRKAIKEDIRNERQAEIFNRQKAEWIASFVKLVDVDVPETLVRSEVERSRATWQHFLHERMIKADDWLKSRNTTLDQLQQEWREAAQVSIKTGLGLAEIAQKESKKLSDNEDFQKLLDDLVKQSIKS